MSMEVTIQIDPAQMKALGEDLRSLPGATTRALVAAVNATSRWTHTRMTRSITAQLMLKLKHLKNSVKIEQANKNKISARVFTLGSRIALFDWGVRPNKVINTRRVKTPLSYQIRRSTGRKSIQQAFIFRHPATGNLFVMARKGRQRFPIRALKGPSITQVLLDTEEIQTVLRSGASEHLNKQIISKIDWLLGRKRGQPADQPAAPEGGAA